MKSRKHRIQHQKWMRRQKYLKHWRKAVATLGATFAFGVTSANASQVHASSKVVSTKKDQQGTVDQSQMVKNPQSVNALYEHQQLVRSASTSSQMSSVSSSQNSVDSHRQSSQMKSNQITDQSAKTTSQTSSVSSSQSSVDVHQQSSQMKSSRTTDQSVKTTSQTNSVSSSANDRLSSMQIGVARRQISGQRSAITTSAAAGTHVQAPLMSNQVKLPSSNVELRAFDFSAYQGNVQRFLQNVAPVATQVANENHIYASVMIAQAALESGWGQSQLAIQGHNLFGVKWNGTGNYVTMPTQEYYNGRWCTIDAHFQAYDSYYDSLTGYAHLITHNFPASTRSQASTPQIAAANLRHGIYGAYATDPDYANLLDNVIADYNLTQFDVYTGIQSSNNQQQNSNAHNSNTREAQNGQNNNDDNIYIVKNGDTLWGISQTHQTTVNELKTANHLTSDLIFVGQKLKLHVVNEVASPQTSTKQTPDTYTVKSGDTLWGISQQFNTTVNTLKSINHLDSDLILVGQVLQLKNQDNHQTNPTNQTTTKTYTVKSGDTLWGISQQFNTSVNALKQNNHLSSNLIFVGQQLVIDPANENPTSPTSTTNHTYIVKSGDTLWGISQQFNTSVNALKQNNHLTSDTIEIGQQLVIGTPSENHQSMSTTHDTPTTYTVKSGDTLWGIANQHHMTVQDLRTQNHLTSNIIDVGQTLQVAPVQAVKSTNGSYTVQSGDSLWQIAASYHTTVQAIKALNHLDSDLIYAGQTLIL